MEQKKVLFLDEAINSFDKESGFFVEKSLLTNKGLTLVNIAHEVNPSLIQYYDEIFVLKDGEISKVFNTRKEKEGFLNEIRASV